MNTPGPAQNFLTADYFQSAYFLTNKINNQFGLTAFVVLDAAGRLTEFYKPTEDSTSDFSLRRHESY